MKRKATSECDLQDENTVKRFRPEHKRDFFTPVHPHSIESWERLIRIASYPHSTAHHNKRHPSKKKQRSVTVRKSRQQCKVERNAVRRPLPGGGSKVVIGKPTAPISYPELEIGPSLKRNSLKQSKRSTRLKDEQEQGSDSTQQSFRAPLAESQPKKLQCNPPDSVTESATSNSIAKEPSCDLSPVKPSREMEQQNRIKVQRWLPSENNLSASNLNSTNADSSINLVSPAKRPSPLSKSTVTYYPQHQQNDRSESLPQKLPLIPASAKRIFHRQPYPASNVNRHGSYNHSISAQQGSFQISKANPQIIKNHQLAMPGFKGNFMVPRQKVLFEQRCPPPLRNQLQGTPAQPHPNRNAYLKARSMQPTAQSNRTVKVEKYNSPHKQQPQPTTANAQKNRTETSGPKSPVQLVDICKDFHLLGGDLKKLEELQIAQFPFLIVPNKPNNAVHPLTALQLRLRDKYTAYLVQIVQHLDYVAAMEGTPINLKHIETIVDIFSQELTFLKSKVSALALIYALYDVVFAKPHSHLYGHNSDIVPRECWQVCRKLYHIWSHLISSLPYRLYYLRYHARSMGLRLAKSPLQRTLLMMIQAHSTMQQEKTEIERTPMHPMLRADSLTFDGPVRDFPIFSLEEDCFV